MAINLRNCLSLGIQRMKSFYIKHIKHQKIQKMQKLFVQNLTEFEEEFKNSKTVNFWQITCENLTAKAKKRAAEFLPNEKDKKKIMETCNKTFAKIDNKNYNKQLYIEVRQAAMLRLIFFQ